MKPYRVEREVSAIIKVYRGDPEAGHGVEDALLWRFVKDEAQGGNSVAIRLMRLHKTPRTRWYA